MPTEVVIPKLGMTMKEGTIVEWVVPDGAAVAVDDVIFILSTDKLDTDITAEVAGTLRHAAAAGECHPCSTVVGWIFAEGEVGAPAVRPVPNGSNGSARIVATPYARRLAGERGIDLAAIAGTGPRGRVVAADLDRAAVATVSPASTPLARRVAAHRGVELAGIDGTGPRGRITKEDVEQVAAAPAGAPVEARATVPLRGMRKVIAERMHASLHEMAQLTLGTEVDVTEAVALRRRLVAEWEPDALRPSVTDLVARAAVRALAEHPNLNASIEADAEQIVLHHDVHLGIAVAVDDGLLVPVVRDAGTRSFPSTLQETARLAAACRDGSISPDELEGSTFTVTALGAHGIDFFTPIINPPNVAILGIGRVRDGVAWDGDRPVRRDMLNLSLTIDHRAVDGAPGAAFLGTVRELLQAPLRLLA